MRFLDGLREMDVSFFMKYISIYNTITSRFPVGKNVFADEWDLCIVLDACRVDLLEEVQSEYDFIDDIDVATSVGSMTAEWVTQTFRTEFKHEIRKTACLSTNPWADRILNKNWHLGHGDNRSLGRGLSKWQPVNTKDLGKLEFVQDEERRLHEEAPHVPHLLTDRAIDIGRTGDYDRVLVHYTLPHSPFIADAVAEERPLYDFERDFSTAMEEGTPLETVWNAYRSNLRLGLSHVETLLSNFDAKRVLITADHGEAFGEWGAYKHPFGWPQPAVRRVPRVWTEANDSGEYEPQYDAYPSYEQTDNLEALGYT